MPILARVEGIEPPLMLLESTVLPLHHTDVSVGVTYPTHQVLKGLEKPLICERTDYILLRNRQSLTGETVSSSTPSQFTLCYSTFKRLGLGR